MAIAATIKGDDGMAACAVLTARDMSAEHGGAAALDCTHHLQLAETDMAGIGAAPCGAVVAENIRNLQLRARHGRRLLCRYFPLSPRLWLRCLAGQLVDRARARGDNAGRHARIMRRRFQPIACGT
jgi:hypothetical protein